MLRGDLFVWHVPGARKYNFLCSSIRTLCKKDSQKKTKNSIVKKSRMQLTSSTAIRLRYILLLETDLERHENFRPLCTL